jgi:methanogenic corrinoid protein MtbC1
VSPERLPNGRRAYSDDEVRRLRLLKRLVDAGHPIGRVASLDDVALRRAADEVRDGGTREDEGAVRRAVLRAIVANDFARSERILARTAALVSPFELVRDVVGPLLTSIGEGWACGDLSVAQEHGASAQIRAVLEAVLRAEQHPRGPRVVAATLPHERHDGGVLAAALVAATAGFSVTHLRAGVPCAEIVGAVTTTGARAVLLSVVMMQRGGATVARSLARALPREVRLIVGGRAAHRYVDALGTRAVTATLDTLGERLRGG